MGEIIAERSTAEWLERLDACDVPCAPILRRGEVIHNEQIVAPERIAETSARPCPFQGEGVEKARLSITDYINFTPPAPCWQPAPAGRRGARRCGPCRGGRCRRRRPCTRATRSNTSSRECRPR